MRLMSVVKVALVAAVVALPSGITVASAKTMKPPPGACAFEKKFVVSGKLCSYQCNPQTNWCLQEYCANGTMVPMLPCYGAVCSAKCGG